MEKLDELYLAMAEYYAKDPKRVQHFVKVHSFARLIGRAEGLKDKELFTLEAAALVHDIGIKAAEKKFGSCSGRLQEMEGPAIAEEMLDKLGFEQDVTERVSYLVGHHHTYKNVDGADYRILLEADALVNAYEDESPEAAVRAAYDRVFRTETGRALSRLMFLSGDMI